ncbi:MAG TPA: hypothetical protein VJ933_07355 [Phaeodactylibacter sp.]|nr:hypothetical protein [Phaeodactylibacter sp.]
MYQSDRSTQELHIVQALRPALQQRGYVWLPRLHQFRKSTKSGFSCLILSLSTYEEASLVEAHLGLRIDDVENLAFPFTNGLPGFQPESMSLVTPIAKLFGQRYQRLSLQGPADFQRATTTFTRQMEEEGFAFLEKYGRLETLDRLLNEQPNEPVPLLHNQINRCFRAIVTAKLTQRDDFPDLVTHYADFLAEELYAPQPTLHKYERLRQFLLHYSMN